MMALANGTNLVAVLVSMCQCCCQSADDCNHKQLQPLTPHAGPTPALTRLLTLYDLPMQARKGRGVYCSIDFHPDFGFDWQRKCNIAVPDTIVSRLPRATVACNNAHRDAQGNV
jgi:hypothetical protein